MLKVYTSTIWGYHGPNKLDITVKSGVKIFAPTWDMVLGYKNGTITKEEYIEKYMQMMRESYKRYKRAWTTLLNGDRVVLCCYCKPGDFCHRLLLAEILEKLGAEYCGEI